MARDSYKQSIGNPLQHDRLPGSWPTIEFPCRRVAGIEAFAIVLCWVVCLFATSLVAWFMTRPAHIGPMVLPVAVAFVIGSLWFLMADNGSPPTASNLSVRSYITATLRHELVRLSFNAGLLSAILAVLVFRALPQLVHELLAAIVLGVLADAIGRHYVGICTTSPMRRSEAWACRTACDSVLRAIAAWPVIVVGLSSVFPIFWDLSLAGVFVAMLAAVFIGYKRPADILHAPWQALVEWCTYNLRDARAPGLYIGSAGSWLKRLYLTAVWCFLLAASIGPAIWNVADTHSSHNARFSMILSAPVFASLTMPLVLCWPVLVYARLRGTSGLTPTTWNDLIIDLHNSPDPIERESVFAATVLDDGSPVLIPRSTFKRHAHFLGDSGSGKTSLGLVPLLEQMIQFGDCSFVVLDLKGDSLELFAAIEKASSAVRTRTGQPLPVKHFTIQRDRSTFAFNPLAQSFWHQLDPHVQTDILCAAFALNYGTDYGASWFTAGNFEVCHRAVLAAGGAKSFCELSAALTTVLSAKGANKLDRDIRSAGLHVQLILKRLADIHALNVHVGDSQSSATEAIDLARVFHTPELLYFHLPSMLMPSVAPEIARIVIYLLLSAATMTRERRCQVFLVVDEFQRIIADNLESILQLARSMNVGVILANQTMEDLRTRSTDLVPSLESNCAFRQWFAVSCSDDRARVVGNSGEVLEEFETITVSGENVSHAFSERLTQRLTQNDVLLASDHPNHSILCLKNGAGYAQYGGFPFLVTSDYHITASEYQSRCRMAWPTPGNGAFIPADIPASSPPQIVAPQPSGPRVTTEFFGPRQSDDDDEDGPASALSLARGPRPGNGPRKPPRNRKGKS